MSSATRTFLLLLGALITLSGALPGILLNADFSLLVLLMGLTISGVIFVTIGHAIKPKGIGDASVIVVAAVEFFVVALITMRTPQPLFAIVSLVLAAIGAAIFVIGLNVSSEQKARKNGY